MSLRASIGIHSPQATQPQITLTFITTSAGELSEERATSADQVAAIWGNKLPETLLHLVNEMFKRDVIAWAECEKLAFGMSALSVAAHATDFEGVSLVVARLSNVAFYATGQELVVDEFAIPIFGKSVTLMSVLGLFRPYGIEALKFTPGSPLNGLTPIGKKFVRKVLDETRATHVHFNAALRPEAVTARLTLPSEEELLKAIFSAPEEDDTDDESEEPPWHCQVPIISYPDDATAQDTEQLSRILAEILGIRPN